MMHNKEINNIVIIGTGNVATNFAMALNEKGKDIVQIYSRTEESAKELADKVSADYTTELHKLEKADIYIVAVTDSAIEEVVRQIKIKNGIIVHTAGAANIDILKSVSSDYGVIYPLQTLIKDKNIDFYNKVPLCIEANNEMTEEKLLKMAELIAGKVYKLNSQKRLVLHLAATFANNFTNYMYVVADKLLKSQNIPFETLKSLIEESTDIIIAQETPAVYTGPAARKDMNTIKKHLELLKNHTEFKKLYELITKNIINKI